MPKTIESHTTRRINTINKCKPKLWTKPGLIKLGQIIRASRKSKKLSQEETAALIREKTGESIRPRTLSSIEISTGMPEFNTLAIIAAAGFVTKNGKILDIYDFIDIASESEVIAMESPLWRLIEDHLIKQDITLSEFAEISGVELRDLQAIAQGQESEDYETDLILISRSIDNPRSGERFASYLEMLEYCNQMVNRHQSNHLIANQGDC